MAGRRGRSTSTSGKSFQRPGSTPSRSKTSHRVVPVSVRWVGLVLAVVAVVLVRIAFVGHGTSAITSAPNDRQARAASAMLAALPRVTPLPLHRGPRGASAAALRAQARPLPPQHEILSRGGIALAGGSFEARQTSAGSFTRVDGPIVGFGLQSLPPWYETMLPGENEFAPVAEGDVNGDGWPDVAVGTRFGVRLYINLGGRFGLESIDDPALDQWMVTYVALVDLTGNKAGLPDLFVCTWGHDCRVLINHDGAFSAADQIVLPLGGQLAVHAAAFADVNRDGRLDIVTGTSTELEWNFNPTTDRVYFWKNLGGGHFRRSELPGPRGETLSLLFTDINGDSWPDLYVGNDFDEPDLVYLNRGGNLELATGSTNPLPYSTESTMSIDSGDINNDGKPEIYDGAISFGAVSAAKLAAGQAPPEASCERSYPQNPSERLDCLELGDFQTAVLRSRDITNVTECKHFSDPRRERDCIAAGYLWNEAFATLPGRGSTAAAVEAECARVPRQLTTLVDICREVPANRIDFGQSDRTTSDAMPQQKNTNLLFEPTANGYRDVTQKWGVGFGGWSWNAKFADFDNDTWQDLFVTQGTRLRFDNSSNILYRNLGGTNFVDDTVRAGLEEHVPTGGSVYIDYRMDGRLSIVTFPFALTPVMWRNDLTAGPAFQLTLRQEGVDNVTAIGARVEIRSPTGRVQMREIKASGGYDSQTWPVAEFGLGNWPSVSSITVTWPDGSTNTVSGLTLHSGRYTLTKQH